MTAMTPLALAQGQLPSSIGTLYTCPVGDPIIFKRIVLVNDSANLNEKVYIFLDRDGTDRLLIPGKLEQQNTSMDRSPELTLESGDKIRGYADHATSVNYFIDGIQVTP